MQKRGLGIFCRISRIEYQPIIGKISEKKKKSVLFRTLFFAW